MSPRTPGNRWHSGLGTRLVVTFLLVALIGTATATALAYREARSAVLKRTQDAFQRDVRTRVEALAPDAELPPDQQSLTRFAQSVSAGLSGTPLVVAWYEDLRAVSDSALNTTAITPELRAAARTSGRMATQRVTVNGAPHLVVATPVTYEGGHPSRLEVAAVTPLHAEEQDTAALLRSVRNGLLPVLALTALLALLAARTVLRPVRDLGRATRALAEGDLSIRVEPHGRDELADLAQDFNTTADSLDASVGELRKQEERARRFVADVSHELRTPLAAMTMVATVLDEDAEQLPPDTAQAARTVSAETARLTRLVDDLMEISRIDSGAAELHLTDTDLAETVRAGLTLRGWTEGVRVHLPDGVRIPVDRRRIDVAVANLVGNALRHGAPPVTVTLTTDADTAAIEVADRGPGLTPEALTHVFDRFYKADAARTRSEGSGLGTAIALENARLHGGTIEAANRPDGPGALFTLRLPLRPSPEPADPHEDATP